MAMMPQITPWDTAPGMALNSFAISKVRSSSQVLCATETEKGAMKGADALSWRMGINGAGDYSMGA